MVNIKRAWWTIGIMYGLIGLVFLWLYIFPEPVQKAMDDCEYIPHPIADVAWELYRRELIPIGTALYYSRMTNSDNIDPATCMNDLLGE